MDDATFKRAIYTELESVQRIREEFEKKAGQRAEKGGDLAADEERFPEIWATSLAQRGLAHACECIEAAGALMLNGVWSYPQYALLRAAYESAGATVWLLVPEDTDTRLARLIYQHRESWKYSSKAYSGTPLDDGGEHEERQRWATDVAARLQINLSQGNPRGYEKLIESIDDLPGRPESLLTAWQLCSGVSHAKTWALNTVIVQVESTELYEHGRLVACEPDLDLFLTMLRTARRAVQYAAVLYQIRTAARPHSMALNLVESTGDGGSANS